MALDTSVIAPQNLLNSVPNAQGNQLGQYIGQAQALQQFSQQQQLFNANKAVGSALQSAIDPNTGELDTDKAANLIRDNPAAAPAAQNAIGALYDRKVQQMGLNQQSADLASKLNDSLGQQAGFVLMKSAQTGQAPTLDDVRGILANTAHMFPNPSAAANWTAQITQDMPQDGPGLVKWLQNHMASSTSLGQAIDMRFGRPTTVSTGNSTIMGRTYPQYPGRFFTSDGQSHDMVQEGLTPAQLVEPAQTGQTPAGVPLFSTGARRAQMLGGSPYGGLSNYGGGGGTAGGAPGAPSAPTASPAGAGGVTGGAGAPASSAPPMPASAPGGVGGGVPFGLSPGQSDAARTQQTTGAGLYAQDLAAVPQQRAAINQAQLALQEIQHLGPDGLGRGTQGLNDVKGYLGTFLSHFSPTSGIGGRMLDQVQDYDSLNKILTNIASSQGASIGPHTNAGLDAAQAGNASTHIAPGAAQAVLRNMIAMSRIQTAMPQLYAQLHPDDPGMSGYNQFRANLASQIDPRAGAWDTLDAQGKANVYNSIPQKQRGRFRDTVNALEGLGLLAPDGASPAAGFTPQTAGGGQ